MGSPVLLHNISSPSHPMSGSQIFVQASPFGTHVPVIPTARSVTVARVASPISMDRTYQRLFLRSLKTYFDSTKHLVKKGDLIAISLDTDAVGLVDDSDQYLDDSADFEELEIPNEQ
jgi:peroxin-6